MIGGCVSMKRASQNITAVAVMTALLVQPAAAIEVGDHFSLGASVNHTVTSIIKKNRDGAEFYEEISESDAKEYCDMPVFGLAYPDLKTCVSKNVMKARKIVVECRQVTIRIAEVAYRPKVGGGQWASMKVRQNIIQGDELFELACGKR
jgi:hypothetical protein